MAGMGLFGLGFSEDVGGQGFGKLGYCVAVEQLARANASLWNVIGGSAGLCGTAIHIGGPDEVRARYLPDLLSGKRIGAYGLSEPGAGSDAGGLKTTARRDGDGYVINDEKMGLHGSTTAQLYFHEMRIAAGRRIGEEGEGFKIALRTLDLGRLGLS